MFFCSCNSSCWRQRAARGPRRNLPWWRVGYRVWWLVGKNVPEGCRMKSAIRYDDFGVRSRYLGHVWMVTSHSSLRGSITYLGSRELLLALNSWYRACLSSLTVNTRGWQTRSGVSRQPWLLKVRVYNEESPDNHGYWKSLSTTRKYFKDLRYLSVCREMRKHANVFL